jgi:hypothetical protein
MADELPRGWLVPALVEQFCVKVDESTGKDVLTTAAIDEAGLYLWIQANQYPQLTSRKYRQGLRLLCATGKLATNSLREDLRVLLSNRINELGRKGWACTKATRAVVAAPAAPAVPRSATKRRVDGSPEDYCSGTSTEGDEVEAAIASPIGGRKQPQYHPRFQQIPRDHFSEFELPGQIAPILPQTAHSNGVSGTTEAYSTQVTRNRPSTCDDEAARAKRLRQLSSSSLSSSSLSSPRGVDMRLPLTHEPERPSGQQHCVAARSTGCLHQQQRHLSSSNKYVEGNSFTSHRTTFADTRVPAAGGRGGGDKSAVDDLILQELLHDTATNSVASNSPSNVTSSGLSSQGVGSDGGGGGYPLGDNMGDHVPPAIPNLSLPDETLFRKYDELVLDICGAFDSCELTPDGTPASEVYTGHNPETEVSNRSVDEFMVLLCENDAADSEPPHATTTPEPLLPASVPSTPVVPPTRKVLKLKDYVAIEEYYMACFSNTCELGFALNYPTHSVQKTPCVYVNDAACRHAGVNMRVEYFEMMDEAAALAATRCMSAAPPDARIVLMDKVCDMRRELFWIETSRYICCRWLICFDTNE